MPDENANILIPMVMEWRDSCEQIKLYEAKKAESEDVIRRLNAELNVDLSPLGMTRVISKGSIGKGIVPLLKDRGLRDAVVIDEKADPEKVAEYIGSGQLTEDEVDNFRGKPKDYYKYTKVKVVDYE